MVSIFLRRSTITLLLSYNWSRAACTESRPSTARLPFFLKPPVEPSESDLCLAEGFTFCTIIYYSWRVQKLFSSTDLSNFFIIICMNTRKFAWILASIYFKWVCWKVYSWFEMRTPVIEIVIIWRISDLFRCFKSCGFSSLTSCYGSL